MYKLFTDRNENFECDIAVKNASLKGSIARLMVEANGLNIAFNGRIEGEKCIIPIKRLKGLLEENTIGKMHLEVVVEDTYFKPWEDNFIVEEHTSVKVKINEQKQFSNKPMVEIKKPVMREIKKTSVPFSKKDINFFIPLNEISSICKIFNLGKSNILQRKNDFKKVIKEYFKANPEYNNHRKLILSKIPTFLN